MTNRSNLIFFSLFTSLQQEFHNYGYDDSLLDQLETRKLSLNSDRFRLNKQRNGLTRNVFGERINSPNIKSLASSEAKDNLISSNDNQPIGSVNSRASNEVATNSNDNQIGNGLNPEAKLTTKLLPTKETEVSERSEDESDPKSKNSLETMQTGRWRSCRSFWFKGVCCRVAAFGTHCQSNLSVYRVIHSVMPLAYH